MSELSKGWIETTLKDACAKISDGTHHSPKEQYDAPAKGLYKYVTAKNIRMAGLDLGDLTYVPEKVHREIYNRCNPERGDVLLTKDGVNAGDAAINTLDEEFSLLSSVALLKPKRNLLEPKFLRYYIESPQGTKRLLGEMRGAAIRRIILRSINAASIPIAPLPEQRRIVARIEELFSRLDAGVAALRHAKAQLQRYRQSVLAAAVTGQLTKAWREQHPDTEPAEELLKRISKARAAFFESESDNSEVKRHVSKHRRHKFTEPANWSTPPTWKFASLLTSCQFVVDCHNKTPPYEDSGIPLIRTTNVRNGKLAWPKMKFVNKETAAHWSQRCTPEAGDILFTREAPAGEAAIIPKNTHLCMGQRMMLFRTFHDLLLPSYLLTVIRSHNFQAQYGDKQVGVGVQHLRVGDVESLALPLQSLAEQHQIVAEVEVRTTAIDHLEAELDRQITRSNHLRESTLATAFSGKFF